VRRQGKDMLVAQVEGVDDRAGAEALNRVELYVARDRLPAPDEDEFYIADLIGLRAETAEGVEIGTIVAVRNFGAGDILEIAPEAGGETLMFPFTKAAVPVVEPTTHVVIDIPEEK
jgi:16S rRNA processing protein RimM